MVGEIVSCCRAENKHRASESVSVDGEGSSGREISIGNVQEDWQLKTGDSKIHRCVDAAAAAGAAAAVPYLRTRSPPSLFSNFNSPQNLKILDKYSILFHHFINSI